MGRRESLDPRRSMWDWIAVDLRFYRDKHELSLARLASHLHVDRTHVSNMEAGVRRLDTRKAAILDELWELNLHFQLLVLYATARHDPDWFKAHVIYEQRASVIRTYEALVIPGLLQTPAYARELLIAGRSDDVDAWTKRRIDRQMIITEQRAELWAIISQNAIEWPVGGPDVMRGQLSRLLEMAAMPNVTLRVLPRSVGAHMALEGSFKVITVKEGDVVYMEACGGGRTSMDHAEIAERRVRYDRIGADALTRDQSAELIRRALETYQ